MSIFAICPGEPSGIGFDLLIQMAQSNRQAYWLVFADPEALSQRASLLNLPLNIKLYPTSPLTQDAAHLNVVPVRTAVPVLPAKPDTSNARYVLDCLDLAVQYCLDKKCDALVTGPIQKSTIIHAGIPFTGHTEYLSAKMGVDQVVMLLVTESIPLRVALATTHLPLKDVSSRITQSHLQRILWIIDHSMHVYWDLHSPSTLVLGLNPHAGEQGALGVEEQEVIEPACQFLRKQGKYITGPVSADTAFVQSNASKPDVILAMYHDQGLPVLKALGFNNAVNVTLGLPIIRTSVDHGTALSLVGKGNADSSSFLEAIKLAESMLSNKQRSILSI